MAMYGLLAMAWLLAAAPPGDAREGATGMQRARDGNVAIQEELDAARKAATIEAYDLFLARHPGHPLAGIAREERQRLVAKQTGRKP